jgi:flagellar hook-associated protein 3 FlgL
MRVSTLQYHKRNVNSINTANTNLLKQHEQLSTGKKILSPSDDPVTSSRIKLLEDRASRAERYNKNAVFADNALLADDTNMKTVTDIISTLNELQIRSGNGIYGKQDRETMGLEAQQLLNELV